MRRALGGGAAIGVVCLSLIGCATTPATSEVKVPKATTGGACSPKVGSKAPDLSVGGKPVIARGKVTIVDIWATWCRPCEKSFPKYQELYTKYGSQLEIVGVAMDDEEAGIGPWVEQRGTKFPIAWDSTHAVASCWKPENMPTAYIIDKNGVVRHIHRKWEPGEEKVVEKEIKALF